MSSFLTLTQRHELLPYAHRLRLSGHDVEVVTRQEAYEQSWSGVFTRSVKRSEGHLDAEGLRTVLETARESEATVLTDVSAVAGECAEIGVQCYGLHKMDKGPKHVLRVGGWFDGEQFTHLHLLLYDMGLWPGGLGPLLPGACTLVSEVHPDLADHLVGRGDELKTAGFQGLAQVGVTVTDEGTRGEGLWAGWPWLHSQAFVSGLENFGEVLSHEEAPRLESPVVTVVPFSVQPYPARAKGRVQAVELASPELAARVFWHDVQVDPEGQQLRTGGLDGLVGVVRGAGSTPTVSRLRALQTLSGVHVDGLQWRTDAAERAQSQLTELELRGLL